MNLWGHLLLICSGKYLQLSMAKLWISTKWAKEGKFWNVWRHHHINAMIYILVSDSGIQVHYHSIYVMISLCTSCCLESLWVNMGHCSTQYPVTIIGHFKKFFKINISFYSSLWLFFTFNTAIIHISTMFILFIYHTFLLLCVQSC